MKTVVFDLAVILTPPLERRLYLLHFLDKAKVELAVRSPFGRHKTKAILRDAELLRYFTDLHFNGEGFSVPDALHIHQPAHARLEYVEEALERELGVPAYARALL